MSRNLTNQQKLKRRIDNKLISTYTDYTTFGGGVYESDFCTDFGTCKNFANRIAAEARFDKKCSDYLKLKNQKKVGK